MFDIFFEAPVAVQIHLISALEALALGPFVLYRRRRDRLHKIMGYVWATNMLITALSSFFILETRVMGPFSPIHLLSLWTLFNLRASITAVRQGRLDAHRKIMAWLYWGGLVTAGILSFIPGRLMSQTLFSLTPVNTWLVVAGLLVAVAYLARLQLSGRAGPVSLRRAGA